MGLKELRAAVKAAYERMVAAHTAIEAADESADLDALSTGFEEARSAHVAAKVKLERAEAVEEARAALPVNPTEDDESREGSSGSVSVGDEPMTYQRGGDHSFFLDQYQAGKGDRRALERLERHQHEMSTVGMTVQERAIAETAGAGGEFVAPLYLQNEFLALARAARPYADAMSSMPLPPNANTINIPRMVTGTATATQADLGAVQSTDITTGNLAVPVITIAGQQDLARQLLDRAVPGIDQILFSDLIADYNTKVDVQAINGSGAGGNAKGVLNATGTNAITYTGATPTLPELYSKIADAIQQVHTGRFLPPSLIVMHPRRWGWCLAALDTQNRPLVVPAAGNPYNAVGNLKDVASQMIVGSMMGLPVVTDASIPINLGAGTNEDRVIVTRVEDSWLLEDNPVKTKTFEEVLSNTLSIRVQVFNYLALTHERYPKAHSIISGTGLVTPVF